MELNINSKGKISEEEKMKKKKITRAIRRVITGDNKNSLPMIKKYELGSDGVNPENSSNFSNRKNLKGLTLSIADN